MSDIIVWRYFGFRFFNFYFRISIGNRSVSEREAEPRISSPFFAPESYVRVSDRRRTCYPFSCEPGCSCRFWEDD